MIYSPMVNKAINIMFEAHKNQKDKSGVPYVFHPFHLAEQMTSEDSTIVALLHDTIEDTDITKEYLKAQGFKSEIIDAIVLLTRKKNEDYFEYIKRIKDNPIAREVKIADLKHNSDLKRLEKVKEADMKRTEKYHKALEILKSDN
jgi:(p)ppGpp synthase/HD superfamily hydrolase